MGLNSLNGYFMKIAHDYIIAQKPTDVPDDGYYHDVKSLVDSGVEVGVVGTSNYNNLFKEISDDLDITSIEVFHLNGSTKDFYNPYKN